MNLENRMPARRLVIPLALALLGAGCANDVGPHPTAVEQPLVQAPHFLEWSNDSSPASGTPDAHLFLASAVGGLSLDRYTATFWAVGGQKRAVQINYLSATGGTASPFLRLSDVEPSYVPGRGGLMPGDSVLITVTVDPTVLQVTLEPSGLLFRDPAQLQIWYGGASGDLNGDRKVDDSDAMIESQLLGMWYRENANYAWTKIAATQSLSGKSFTAPLQHFSQYAVCW